MPLHRKVSSGCNEVVDMRECTKQRSYVVGTSPQFFLQIQYSGSAANRKKMVWYMTPRKDKSKEICLAQNIIQPINQNRHETKRYTLNKIRLFCWNVVASLRLALLADALFKTSLLNKPSLKLSSCKAILKFHVKQSNSLQGKVYLKSGYFLSLDFGVRLSPNCDK